MNEQFEAIMKLLIDKHKDFRYSYFQVIGFIVVAGFLYVYADNKNFSYIMLFLACFSVLIIPVRKNTVKKHIWVLENYQRDKDQCLLILTAFKNNLKGPTLFNYFITTEKRELYNQAIKLLKEVKDE